MKKLLSILLTLALTLSLSVPALAAAPEEVPLPDLMDPPLPVEDTLVIRDSGYPMDAETVAWLEAHPEEAAQLEANLDQWAETSWGYSSVAEMAEAWEQPEAYIRDMLLEEQVFMAMDREAQQAAQEASAQEAEASLEEGAEAPEKAPAQEEELLAAVRPPKAPAEKKPEARRSSRKKKKSGPNPVLIVVSLAIVVAAIFIVMRVVVPAFQTGIFSSGEPAESLTLDMSQLDLAEAGTTMNLVPTFSPEGSTGTLTWTSSDEAVATVDDQGNVTAVAPGNATITATLENGQSATCNVTCTWDSQGTEDLGEGAPAEEAPAEEAPAGPALSSNDITLDAAGDSQQLTLTGGEGEVTWASGDKAVATVDDQGNVTAVAPGRTTVTATVGEQTLKCEVRCIW